MDKRWTLSMETANHGINKREPQHHNCDGVDDGVEGMVQVPGNQNGDYMLQFRNFQNDKPIDLTSGGSSGNQFVQIGLQESKRMLSGPQYFPNVENQEEVLKAAKSLFSKRTRTLYHWMYPNTPKFQLKSAVALAWDTMGLQEKQFYISQVLGKFGYLQSSLMVNPQLGGMTLPTVPLLNVDHPDLSNMETRNAVTNLLQDGNTWTPSPAHVQGTSKKRGRPRGSKRTCPEKVYRNKKPKHAKSHEEDDFNDDPELRKELEQFQWALHLVEK